MTVGNIAMSTSGPPPYDNWHPEDPQCDNGESAARAQKEYLEKWPGLSEEMEKRLANGVANMPGDRRASPSGDRKDVG